MRPRFRVPRPSARLAPALPEKTSSVSAWPHPLKERSLRKAGAVLHEPRNRPPQSEAQHLYPERTNIFQRVGDGVAVVASGGRPIIESAATFATLINTPDAKTHDAVNRAVSRHAHNLVGATYRADVSGRRSSHDTASQVTTARA